MKIIKSIIAVIGILVICGGGWLAWRNAQPVLDDPQQIQANLTAICEAAARHSSQGILNHLATGFRWNDHNRHDVASLLSGAMFELNEVRVETSNIDVQVQGNTAISVGNYTLTVRQRHNDQPSVYSGRFKAEWEKQNGKWLVVKAHSEGQFPL